MSMSQRGLEENKAVRKWTTIVLGRRISVEEIEEIARRAFEE